MSRRLVIANRGEIARRILRAGRARGHAVAVISTPEDADALVRREADAVLEVDRFLDGPAIVAAAKAWGADLLHPGYGFLSERADFAEAVEAAGIAFVGPTPESMRLLGGKEPAKARALACGVPVLPALLSHELAALPPEAWGPSLASRGLQPPFLVKASGGGGGRGMRVVGDLASLPEALRQASEEARAAFGDGTVFVERYLSEPRHIEAQVFGDGQGGGVFLGERECSLQRRHQKVLEESPSAAVGPELREALGRAALALVRDARYRGAGTVEFLVDGEGRFYFLEVNARLQVEHPVTELVTGMDLVQAQLELAEGRWPAALGDPGAFRVPQLRGVALEARVLAEDPRQGFIPTPGTLKVYREPSGEGIRVDTGVAEGGRVNDRFDSMIAKVVAWGPDRAAAMDRLAMALEGFVVQGCTTNLPFLQALARHADVREGRTSTAWIGAHLAALNAPLLPEALRGLVEGRPFREALSLALRGSGGPASAVAGRFAAQGHPELSPRGRAPEPPFRLAPGARTGAFQLSGPALTLALRRSLSEAPGTACGPGLRAAAASCADPGFALGIHASRGIPGTLVLTLLGETLQLEDPLAHRAHGVSGAADAATGTVRAPMAGKVLEVRAAVGDAVDEGQALFILESMKMRFEVPSTVAGRLAELLVQEGQTLSGAEAMAVVRPDPGAAPA